MVCTHIVPELDDGPDQRFPPGSRHRTATGKGDRIICRVKTVGTLPYVPPVIAAFRYNEDRFEETLAGHGSCQVVTCAGIKGHVCRVPES